MVIFELNSSVTAEVQLLYSQFSKICFVCLKMSYIKKKENYKSKRKVEWHSWNSVL